MDFEWQRYWCLRNGVLRLTREGFLEDPTEPWGAKQNPDAQSFASIDQIPCLALLGEPGIGKSHTLLSEFHRTRHQDDPLQRYLFIDLRHYSSDSYLNFILKT